MAARKAIFGSGLSEMRRTGGPWRAALTRLLGCPLAASRASAVFATILGGKSERTIACSECGAAVVIADGDWNDLQAPAMQDRQQKQSEDIHDGQELSSVEVYPSPFTDWRSAPMEARSPVAMALEGIPGRRGVAGSADIARPTGTWASSISLTRILQLQDSIVGVLTPAVVGA